MNRIKPFFLTAITVIAVTGCSTPKYISLDTSISPISAPLNIKKNAPLKESELMRWSLLDIQKDTVPGMSVDRAYKELLKDKVGTKIIVGVIDSGVDIEHEDLKSVIWTNPKEIPSNGKDDDRNGFVDDIHGWNFLGNITKENLEYERIVKNPNLVDEATYKEAKAEYDKKFNEANSNKERYNQMYTALINANEVVSKELKKDNYTLEEVKAIVSTDEAVNKSKNQIQRMFSFGLPINELKKTLEGEIKKTEEAVNGINIKEDYRKVLGDNPQDIKDTKYGDNNVMGPDKKEILHGTHVAGIIAQERNNTFGTDGVANNVSIMAIRAVPDGDEYDKDIALAIRYAVDNGAKVINGSFGKAFSPNKQWVFDAIKYAQKHDVLIVHAAGNSAKNLDYFDNFPNDSADKKTELADNLITIGALNFEYGPNLVARFSNIGKINVDVFAPGVKIYATTPENKYQYLQGTSMAAPNTAGVAALIRSYFPKLTASQVKHILMDSGVSINMNVVVGGNPKDIRPFSEISKTGKIVNAYNALLLAAKLSKN